MKKLINVIALAILTQTGFAQKVGFGVSAGATFASMRSEYAGEKDNSDGHIGFTTGVFTDIAFTKNFSFIPALNFVQKGGKESDPDFKVTATTNYLEVPLNFVYKAPGRGASFIMGGGPSFAYGVGGKAKVTTGGITVSEKIKFGSKTDDDFKPFEMAANVLMGVELSNGISIVGNYNYGLSNISRDMDGKARNSYIGLRVGYRINK